MATIYNISLKVETINDKLVSPESAQKIVKIFDDAGLTGEKHVDNIGRVYTGFDSKCDVYVVGEYDIFVRNRPEFKGKTMREIMNYQKLITSGFDNRKQEALDLGYKIVNILEEENPLARDMPMVMYFQLPHSESWSINTSVGIQSIHVHNKNHAVFQFWRPLNTSQLYDFDTLQEYLANTESAFFMMKKLNDEQIKVRNIVHKLYHSLMKNPDNVGDDFFKLLDKIIKFEKPELPK